MYWKESEQTESNFGVKEGRKASEKYIEKLKSVKADCESLGITVPKEIEECLETNEGISYQNLENKNYGWNRDYITEEEDMELDEDGDEDYSGSTITIDVNKIPNDVDFIKIHIWEDR